MPLMEPAKILPLDVREALMAAARLPTEWERLQAINNVTERAKRRYPQFFHNHERSSTL